MTLKYNPRVEDNFCYFEKSFQGVSSSAPSSPQEGWTYINSGDNGYYIYYSGSWQLLHTLTPASGIGIGYWIIETDFVVS